MKDNEKIIGIVVIVAVVVLIIQMLNNNPPEEIKDPNALNIFNSYLGDMDCIPIDTKIIAKGNITENGDYWVRGMASGSPCRSSKREDIFSINKTIKREAEKICIEFRVNATSGEKIRGEVHNAQCSPSIQPIEITINPNVNLINV